MKNERLVKMKQELETIRDKAIAAAAPLHKKREAILAKMAPLQAELDAINVQIMAAEAPAREVGNEIAAIARGLGAHSLINDGVPNVPKP